MATLFLGFGFKDDKDKKRDQEVPDIMLQQWLKNLSDDYEIKTDEDESKPDDPAA